MAGRASSSWILLTAGLLAGPSIPQMARAVEPLNPSLNLIEQLPEGVARTTLERMPPDQQQLLIDAARSEVAEAALAQGRGEITPEQAIRAVEDTLSLRTALLLGAGVGKRVIEAEPALRNFSAADLVTAAYAPDTEGTLVAQSLSEPELARLREDLLNYYSPYIYRPFRPCTVEETAGRLPECVDRSSFSSIVGLGWRLPDGRLEFNCTGQLLDSRTILTAKHCLRPRNLPQGAVRVALSHFTRGTTSATRKKDGRVFAGLSMHGIAALRFDGDLTSTEPFPWSFDIAIVELEQAVPNVSAFPTHQAQLPDPLHFTVGGWGVTDVEPIEGLALELTTVSLANSGATLQREPSFLTWTVGMQGGGTVCSSDSGGPIYAGLPDGNGRLRMKLVGVVAGGDYDCTGGEQFLTDLTRPTSRNIICRYARQTAFCRP